MLINTLKIRQTLYFLNCCLWRLFLFAFTFLPVNGLMYSLKRISSVILSCFHWWFMYFFVLFPTISTQSPLRQNVLFPYLYFKFARLSKIMRELFPFKYPTISDTCIWTIYDSDNILPLSFAFLSHHCLSLFPISAFIFPYIICLLYFGANMIFTFPTYMR